jgi:glutaminyl-tRNA synthetase
MYDFAHALSDAIEGITHSLCTLEFEDHRPLYDWFLDQLQPPHRPRQIEFARLNLSFTVLSKRLLNQLVRDRHVTGWDDPRMPTLAGLRRRGYTPEAIREFCERIRVARADSVVDMELLENTLREDLNPRVPRVLCVHRPLRVVIDNYPADRSEELEAPFFPDDPPRMGARKLPFSRVLYIESDDFMLQPAPKFHRLAPGREVRLRWSYVIRCTGVDQHPDGSVREIRCTYDPATRNAPPADRRKIGGTIHWLSAAHALPVELRIYDRLFSAAAPAAGGADFKASLNPGSLELLRAWIEPSVASARGGERFQFERKGYYMVDPVDSRPGGLVFNRIVPLRDSWAKLAGASTPQ